MSKDTLIDHDVIQAFNTSLDELSEEVVSFLDYLKHSELGDRLEQLDQKLGTVEEMLCRMDDNIGLDQEADRWEITEDDTPTTDTKHQLLFLVIQSFFKEVFPSHVSCSLQKAITYRQTADQIKTLSSLKS
jgi:hypothetical protein